MIFQTWWKEHDYGNEERQAKRTKFLDSDRNEDEDVEARREKQPESEWLLKPCIYKRR